MMILWRCQKDRARAHTGAIANDRFGHAEPSLGFWLLHDFERERVELALCLWVLGGAYAGHAPDGCVEGVRGFRGVVGWTGNREGVSGGEGFEGEGLTGVRG